MRRLSSVIKPRHGRWIAVLFVATMLLSMGVVWTDVHAHAIAGSTALLVCATPIVAALSRYRQGTLGLGLVDEVWADGDQLLVKWAGQSIRLPLTDVHSIRTQPWGNVMTLSLHKPCLLGEQIRFMAPGRRGPGRHFIEVELQHRLDAALKARA